MADRAAIRTVNYDYELRLTIITATASPGGGETKKEGDRTAKPSYVCRLVVAELIAGRECSAFRKARMFAIKGFVGQASVSTTEPNQCLAAGSIVVVDDHE